MSNIKSLKLGEEPPKGARVYETTYIKKNGEKRIYRKYLIPKEGPRKRKKKKRTLCIEFLKKLDEECCAEILEFLKQEYLEQIDSESQ